MATQTKLEDPMEVIHPILSTLAYSELHGVLNGEPHPYSDGAIARLGQSLVQIGNDLLGIAKLNVHSSIVGQSKEKSRIAVKGAMFQWRKPAKRFALNPSVIAEIKEQYPPEEYPAMYKEVKIAPRVDVTFSKAKGASNDE